MKQINLKKTVGLAALIILMPTMAMAYGGQGKGNGSYGPPQAAIDACDGKVTGDAVEFTNRRNDTISGTCQEEGGLMLAMPEGGHRGNGYGRMGRSGSGCGDNEWRGKHRQGRHEMRAELLDLTEEQQEQIEAIRSEERAAHRELREKMQGYSEQMRELTDAGTFDEDAIRAIAEAKAKTQVELAVAKARTHSKIHAIMTSEQQELAKNFRSERQNKRGGHRRGAGGGWQSDID
jgi:Spy/CpxP family protein refolding chaperone